MIAPQSQCNANEVKITEKPLTARKRIDALLHPPPRVICEALNYSEISIEWLAGDGSDRCYYRIFTPIKGLTYVLMQLSPHDAELLRDDDYDWINIGKILQDSGIFAPKLVKKIPDYAALIIEDYGNIMFETTIKDHLSHKNFAAIEEQYKEAISITCQFLNINKDKDQVWQKRAFDFDRFVWEMNFFLRNFFELVINKKLSTNEFQLFQEESLRLSQYLCEQSKWFVHRDFHSRNIMYKDNKLAIIDFQDARLGPPAYDIISLIFDSYVPLPSELRMKLLNTAIEMVKENVDIDTAKIICDIWKPTLLQRQLKAMGSFGYLTLEKKRGDYLKYVEPALSTLEETIVSDDRWPFLSKRLIEYIRTGVKEMSCKG